MRLFVLLVSVLALAGCKQGLGERCQITADCKEPLVCVSATNTCSDVNGTSNIDADVPIDAAIDAAPDAAADAMIDAP